MKSWLIASIIGLTFLAANCTMDKVSPVIIENNTNVCDSIPKDFTADVEPIFTDYCMGCHNPSNASGGYDLTTKALIISNIDICIKTMNHEVGVVAMPYQEPAMSDSLIQVVECWASAGTP